MILPNRLSIGLAALIGLVAWNTAASATAVADFPPTLAGSYLAARSADMAKDIGAAASFYSDALADDPQNPTLLERTVILDVADGNIALAIDPAKRLIKIDSGNPIARLVLAARSVKQHDYAAVSAGLANVAKAPLATLTIGLIDGWIDFGLGKVDDGLKAVDALSGPSWYGIFKDYHSALILDAAGRTSEAAAAITKAYTADGSALRVVEGYARIMARAGKRDAGRQGAHRFRRFIAAASGGQGARRRHPRRQADRPGRGNGRRGRRRGALRAGLGHRHRRRTGTADRLSAAGDLSRPVAVSGRHGDRRRAAGLEPLRRGHRVLWARSREPWRCAATPICRSPPACRTSTSPTRRCAMSSACSMPIRATSRRPSCSAISTGRSTSSRRPPTPTAAASRRSRRRRADDWRIYYYRGVAEERSKQWPKAEADFQHALKLSPGQASVLNYLGYSWVDMGTNLDKALAMIKQAVDARPNDGYIVDSLGWAYYRLHRYKDAVATLERAIELKPEDSTINDHLGDAYWQVGRKLEATFQWAHARDMNPEPGQLPAILDKLKHGLKAAANGTASKASAVGTPGAAADPKAHSALPQSITVGAGESLWDIAAKVYGNSDMYLRIYDANRDRIHDPDRIFPGMTLNLPAVGAN